MIRAVTLDAGGTLIEPWPSVGDVYAAAARACGIECRAENLNANFGAAWRGRSSFDYTRAAWLGIVRESFQDVCEVTPALFQEVYQRFAGRDSWLVYDDVLPALDQLQARGIRLAVISNWDERLVPLLRELELAACFETIVVSSAFGAHKPSQEIFQHAARQLSLRPDEILHAGDSEAEDVQGALAAGFHARRIRRAGREHAHDVERLTALTNLLDGQ